MGSLSGILHRPVVAAAIVTLASLSTDFSDKRWSLQLSDSCSTSGHSHSSLSNSVQEPNFSRVSYISVSMLANLSFVSVPVPNVNFPFSIRNPSFGTIPSGCSVAYSPLLINLYHSAELAKGPKPIRFKHNVTTSSPDVLYISHLPEPNAFDITGASNCSSEKSRTVVVLLGWLGSKQKHLKKYAEWYTSRGFHAITFTFPVGEILSYRVGGKAEKDIELLVEHLANWLEEELQKKLVFHTFSNTGWLTYGVILEKLQKQDPSLLGRIGGCIVDSAPVAIPDPQVWASGFSAAFLKKSSVATKMHSKSDESNVEPSLGIRTTVEPKPALAEAALLFILKKFFGVVLNLPSVNRRLSDVLNVLSSRQPRCPQLYIYSSADRVIPAGSVESFIEEQRKAGLEVRACNFVSTPHVDHFRNDPKLYTTQLTEFLEDCVLTCCRNS
ncbi:hypothetical protein K2173_006823 [Erythroxylum novogranatense]|uniref:Transmembrane protein 53 n=1 Tax=Erythroxylum novogranatense TaxID=1862640 RepID=A0AAV8SZ21_9ROSI|nr:hypothetical protein K2173_006823 [Erythroxylum novogranatense]